MLCNTINNTETKHRSTICCKLITAMIASSSLLASPALAGDCEPTWDTTLGSPGMSGGVWALTEYDGHLIAGGEFSTAGWQSAKHIARWDGSMWHPFIVGNSIGVSGQGGFTWVSDLHVHKGDLVAAGSFTKAGGITVNSIARWDGSTWHPFTSGGQIGLGGGGSANAIAVYNGDLIVAGNFTTAGGKTVNRIARWDGSEWHSFTSGGQVGVNLTVSALAVYDGDLIVGGHFTTAGGQTVNHIARWDGSAWHPLVSGGQIGLDNARQPCAVYALAVRGDDLIVGGRFATAGGITVNRIARWDGSAWHALASGGPIGVGVDPQSVGALLEHDDDLIAGGTFATAGGQTVKRLARWDGSAWHPFIDGDHVGVGVTSGSVVSLTQYEGRLVVAGGFVAAGGNAVHRIAAWGGCARGACCVNGTALELTPDECAAAGGVFYGAHVPPGSVVCDAPCPADLTGSGSVGVADLLQLLSAWGPCP